MRLLLPTIALILLVTACTTTNEIIIDQKGVDMSKYEENLADCESYAQQVPVARKAAKGGASGAVVGGAIGSVSDHRDTGEGAAIGAITGVAKGVNEGQRSKVRVVKNCLRGRGYRVLN
jgi:outer membrane lipoprotein SlyB